MTSYQDIGVSQEGLVAIVEIHRPPHNFFDYKLIRQLSDAFERLDEEPDCRAIVLAANGKSFCAGANFSAGDNTGVASANTSGEFSAQGFGTDTVILYEEAVRLFRTKKPIIAAVHGAAVGGGLGVALLADFRVTCPQARFSANFATLGIHPGFGLTVTLPRLIGSQQANLMFYTGRRIKGDEALSIGLADALSPNPEAVRADAMKLATEIAANAPLAVQSVRATMRAGLADLVATQTAHELKEQQRLRATKDADEGIKAVSERRPGRFQGR